MNYLQSLTRSLLAVGHAEGNDPKDQYLLYVHHGTQSYLQCQQWIENSLIKQSLIVDAVRPNSTAAYLITPKARLVICVSPASILDAYVYDDEDHEWIDLSECDEEIGLAPLPMHNVHPEGLLAGTVDSSGRVHLVFQDNNGQLVLLEYLMTSWIDTVLSANSVLGSPLAVTIIEDTRHIFYTSASDGYVHVASGSVNGDWDDRIVAKYEIEKGVKRMEVGYANQDEELYVLTNGDRLLKINVDSGHVKTLGVVKEGKFVSERSVDQCVMDAWNGKLTSDILKLHLQDDPTCIDAAGGDQEITPLAAATIRGHVNIVRMLLQHKANPNTLSFQKRTPLFHATSSTAISDPVDRLAIVRLFLEAGANVDECYPENGFSTPLMNAISVIGDNDVVNELLKNGASPSSKDVAGQSANMLAKGTPMEDSVAEKAQEENFTPFERSLMEFLVALLVFLVAYTKSQKAKTLVEQVVVKLQERE